MSRRHPGPGRLGARQAPAPQPRIARLAVWQLVVLFVVAIIAVAGSATAAYLVTRSASAPGPSGPPPEVTANFTFEVDNLSARFSDHSTVTGGTITGWQWTFGDGVNLTASDPDVEHVYGLPAGVSRWNYTVNDTVFARSPSGVLASSTASLQVPVRGTAWYDVQMTVVRGNQSGGTYYEVVGLDPTAGLLTNETIFSVENTYTGYLVVTSSYASTCSAGVPVDPSTCPGPTGGLYCYMALVNATGDILAIEGNASAEWNYFSRSVQTLPLTSSDSLVIVSGQPIYDTAGVYEMLVSSRGTVQVQGSIFL